MVLFPPQPASSSEEELFQLVKDMCQHKLASEIYEKLKTEIDNHVRSVCQDLMAQYNGVSPESFLPIMNKSWMNHCRDMVCILVLCSQIITSSVYLHRIGNFTPRFIPISFAAYDPEHFPMA